MIEQKFDTDTRSRLRSYPVAQTVRVTTRRFHPITPLAPKLAKPIEKPYSRRPSSSSFINDILTVRNDVLQKHSKEVNHLKPSTKTTHRLKKTNVSAQDITSQHRPVRSVVLKRQFVSSPNTRQVISQQTNNSAVVKARHSKAQMAMTCMAILIFILGLWVSFSAWRTNHFVKSQVSALAQKNNNESSDGTIKGDEIPDETKPKGSLNDYRVAADMPRFISIPKLSVKSRILRLGVSADNELKTPASIYDAGWYDGSSKPGEEGAALLDGHINGATQPGVFFGLKKLMPEDIITIERGDGKVMEYKVVKSQSFSKDGVDMSSALAPIVPGKKGLNLITCDGKKVNGKSFTYDHRLIVYAEQVN